MDLINCLAWNIWISESEWSLFWEEFFGTSESAILIQKRPFRNAPAATREREKQLPGEV